jgi:hypothetical protein
MEAGASPPADVPVEPIEVTPDTPAAPAKPKKKPKPRKGSGRRKVGRQPGISKERVAVLVKGVAHGLPRAQCARLARISVPSLCNWMARGQEAWEKANENPAAVPKDDRLYVELFLQSDEALSETLLESVKNIRKAGKKGAWQAEAWLLTRLAPGRFADNRQEIRELRRALDDVLKQLAEYKNTRLPDQPAQPPADGRGGAATGPTVPPAAGEPILVTAITALPAVPAVQSDPPPADDDSFDGAGGLG